MVVDAESPVNPKLGELKKIIRRHTVGKWWNIKDKEKTGKAPEDKRWPSNRSIVRLTADFSVPAMGAGGRWD